MGREKIRALILLFVFALPLLFLCAVFSRIHEKIATPKGYRIPAGTRVIILGDSHAVFDLDPERIGRAVNFSSNGESYIHNYYKLKHVLQNSPALRTVILPIDLHSFSDFRSDRIQFNLEWLQYLDYLELGRYKKQRFFYWRELACLRLFGFRGQFRQFYERLVLGRRDAPVSALDRGFSPKMSLPTGSGSALRGWRRASRQLEGADIFSPEMVFFFKKILDLASRHGLNIVLLKSPVSPEYLEAAGTLMDVDRYYERIRGIAANYSHVHFIDKQRLFHKQAGLFFRDAQHLNGNGARIFSGSIRRNLIALGLLEAAGG